MNRKIALLGDEFSTSKLVTRNKSIQGRMPTVNCRLNSSAIHRIVPYAANSR